MQSNASDVLRIEAYGDITCPWCWIGGHRLAAAITELGNGISVQAAHRPFQLDPNASEQPVPLPELLGKMHGASNVPRMIAQMNGVGQKEGLKFNFEAALAVNTLKAHQLLWLAGHEHSHAVQSALLDLLFEAYFQNGLNVADNDVLVSLAVKAGMDAARAKQALQAGEYRNEVLADLKTTNARGIRPIPALIFPNGETITGASDVPSLLRVLQRQRANATRASS